MIMSIVHANDTIELKRKKNQHEIDEPDEKE